MRIYSNLFDLVRETERDLWEMGIKVSPRTYQDKIVDDYHSYTKEIPGYSFLLKLPEDSRIVLDVEDLLREELNIDRVSFHISGVLNILDRDSTERLKVNEAFSYIYSNEYKRYLDYCLAQFLERVGVGNFENPGVSYLVLSDLWLPFLEDDGKFSYYYPDRILRGYSLRDHPVISLLKEDPETRRAVFSIYSDEDLEKMKEGRRIPCSMFYHVLVRKFKRGSEEEKRMRMVYVMRSCDFYTFFLMDVFMAILFEVYIANLLSFKLDSLVYFTSSLHAFKGDLEKRDIF